MNVDFQFDLQGSWNVEIFRGIASPVQSSNELYLLSDFEKLRQLDNQESLYEFFMVSLYNYVLSFFLLNILLFRHAKGLLDLDVHNSRFLAIIFQFLFKRFPISSSKVAEIYSRSRDWWYKWLLERLLYYWNSECHFFLHEIS